MPSNKTDAKIYTKSHFYGKRLYNNSERCLIWMSDKDRSECKYEKYKYKLKCGHIFHNTCLRLLCGKFNKMHCLLCGDIEEVKENRYCGMCEIYGHNIISEPELCPKLSNMIMSKSSPTNVKAS